MSVLFYWPVLPLFIWLQITNLLVDGYSYGAPPGVCLNIHNVHGLWKPQTSECPFKLRYETPTYSPSQEVNVTLSADDRRPFKGFLIIAHRVEGDKEKPLGTYTNFPEDKAKSTYCITDQDAMLTHINNISITELQFSWKPPDTNEGDVIFKYMVVAEFKTFWIDLTSPVLTAATPLQNVVPAEQESTDFEPIDWNACGRTKGCFYYPTTCSGSDCRAAVTYEARGDEFVFEMSVSRADFIAVGFSDDPVMGKDLVHGCTGFNGLLTVQNGYNPFQYYTRTFRTGFREMSIRQADGKLECRLTRPSSIKVFTEFWGYETYDLNNEYYILLAWGAVYENTAVQIYHAGARALSESKVDFHEKVIIRGSSLPLLTKIHGILMFIAWILFVGIATVLARHYKTGCGASKMLDNKVWLQVHRACAVLAWCCTAAAFVIIFVHVGELTKVSELHSYLGIALMAASTLQVLAGLFRPGPETKIRPVFNWGHWLMGKLSHILAAVTFFFAFFSRIIPSQQRQFGVITVGICTGVQVLWEIIFELKRCRKKDSSEKYVLEDSKEFQISDSTGQKIHVRQSCNNFLLFLYILTLMGMTAACILSIMLF